MGFWPGVNIQAFRGFAIGQSFLLLPCFPFQNGQKGQSSPCGKSSPSSGGQPMLPWLIATDLTPCSLEEILHLLLDFRVCGNGRGDPPLDDRLGHHPATPSWRITPAAILVVLLSSGPYIATVPTGYFGPDSGEGWSLRRGHHPGSSSAYISCRCRRDRERCGRASCEACSFLLAWGHEAGQGRTTILHRPRRRSFSPGRCLEMMNDE